MKPYQFTYSNLIVIVHTEYDDNNELIYVPCSMDDSGGITKAESSNKIECHSLNGIEIVPNRYYLAFQISLGVYVIHNQAAFID